MTLVLDASAALATVVGSGNAAVEAIVNESPLVIAPQLYIPEVTNGLWKYVRIGDLSIDDAVVFFSKVLRLIDQFRSVADLAEDALREAATHRHPVYDLYYVVLARREEAAILTFDNGMKELCAKLGVPLADA